MGGNYGREKILLSFASFGFCPRGWLDVWAFQSVEEVAELAEQAGSMGFTEFARELSEIDSSIAGALTGHIKEDNILYPTVLQTLEPEEWSQVLQGFEMIGYCCFTPGKA